MKVLGQTVPFWSRVRSWMAAPSRRAASRQPAIGLALGGGFARGLAHLGVLKVLEENQIPIHAVAGISAGSIIGGAYAGGVSVQEMIQSAASVKFRDFARWTFSRMALASNARMEQFLARSFRKKTFEELGLPLAVVATDLLSGEPVVFRHGDLVGPVRASCAYPGLFLPVKVDGRTLIDGAFSCAVPVAALQQMGATHVIAVHLLTGSQPAALPTNMIELISQCFSLLQTRNDGEWRQAAQVVIEPDVTGYAWDQFEQASKLIAAGEAAARAAMPTIQSWLRLQPAPTASGPAHDSRPRFSAGALKSITSRPAL